MAAPEIISQKLYMILGHIPYNIDGVFPRALPSVTYHGGIGVWLWLMRTNKDA